MRMPVILQESEADCLASLLLIPSPFSNSEQSLHQLSFRSGSCAYDSNKARSKVIVLPYACPVLVEEV